MQQIQFNQFQQNIHNRHKKILQMNKGILKHRFDQLKQGELDIDEFMLFIIRELKRIERDLNAFVKLYLTQFSTVIHSDLLEDNLQKTALLLAITTKNDKIIEKKLPNLEQLLDPISRTKEDTQTNPTKKFDSD